MAMSSPSLQLVALRNQVSSLLLYQGVFEQPPGRAFVALLDGLIEKQNCASGNKAAILYALGQWFTALAAHPSSWFAYGVHQILRDDNPFTDQAQRANLDSLPAFLVAAARHDLQILQQLFCDPDQMLRQMLTAHLASPLPIPWILEADASLAASLQPQQIWADALPQLIDYYRYQGTGLFGQFRAFRWQAGQLQGVAMPELMVLSQLVGYEVPKQQVIRNTEALLAGLPALNILLYGSRGSGKSALVKALLHEYGDQGLRLIEVDKDALTDLPQILERVCDRTQKFIIFVDDLSFDADETTYKALKVALEGSLTARPPNVVVYATSNRRHLIREFFADRPRPSDADEIHNWDTVQEKLSLSDRFGLTLTFEPANQDTYLQIVQHLAQLAGLEIPPENLRFQALQWATRHNGRSGRTARQFIDFLTAQAANSSSELVEKDPVLAEAVMDDYSAMLAQEDKE